MKIRYMNGIILAVLLLISLIGPVVSQIGGPGKVGMGHEPKMWNASDMMRQGHDLRYGADMKGMGFMHSGAGIYGQYITFVIDNETGAVNGYGIAGKEIFDSIAVEGFDYDSTQVSGAVTRLTDQDGTTVIQVHDNPAAVITIRSTEDYTVNFDLADGVSVSEEELVIVTASGIEVYIVCSAGSCDAAVADGVLSVNAAGNSTVVMRAVPVNMHQQIGMHMTFAREVARNRTGAEICLGRDGSMSVVDYSQKMRVQSQLMNKTRIRLQVECTDPAGKFMAFNLDNTSLMLQDRDRLRIYYDGEPVQSVDDPDKVFNATGVMCYISQESRERAQIMMYIPGFSEHTIDIAVEAEETAEETAATATPATGVPGFGLLIAASGLLSAVYMVRKRIM